MIRRTSRSLPIISLSVDSASVLEDGTANLRYTFTRSVVTDSPLTVTYVVGGTASIVSDYSGIEAVGTTRTVTFGAGSATVVVTVDPTADATVEGDEIVALTLVAGNGYSIGTKNAIIGIITNDDQASITPDSTSKIVSSAPVQQVAIVDMPPLPQSSRVYLSDLKPTASTNGWGAYERDRSNGEQGATDGRTLTLNGTTYPKGLGVHSFSSLTYSLGGSYNIFQSYIGIDDEVGSSGSVVFRILADGVEIFRSGTLTGASDPQFVNLDVTGRQTLQLIVDDADGSNGYDHANWADAQLIAGTAPTATPPSTPALSSSSVYLSDLIPTASTNGWGAYERDRSNGEQGATDGRTLTL
ncbi:MAG: NPCBM/NEW2 domain-containing protein, partial [Prochlorococcaceae cyanobacterium]